MAWSSSDSIAIRTSSFVDDVVFTQKMTILSQNFVVNGRRISHLFVVKKWGNHFYKWAGILVLVCFRGELWKNGWTDCEPVLIWIMWAELHPRKHVLSGALVPPRKKILLTNVFHWKALHWHFWGKGWVKGRACQKPLNQWRCCLWELTRVSWWNRSLDSGATWRMQLNDPWVVCKLPVDRRQRISQPAIYILLPCWAVMWAVGVITLSTCLFFESWVTCRWGWMELVVRWRIITRGRRRFVAMRPGRRGVAGGQRVPATRDHTEEDHPCTRAHTTDSHRYRGTRDDTTSASSTTSQVTTGTLTLLKLIPPCC